MTTNRNIFLATTRYLAIDLAGDVIYFPIWWYSAGLRDVAMFLYRSMQATARYLALRPLLANLFKPMFGQYDRAGRIISFFMRAVLLIGRLLYFIVKVILLLALLLLWIIVPVIVSSRVISVITG